MQIKVIVSEHSGDFQNEVNSYLKEGWQLHGESNIQTNAHQDTWDGSLRTWSRTTYVQVLKK